MRQSILTLIAATTLAFASSAMAAYPEQPIRIVVPSAAGGGSDTLTRLLGQKLTDKLGQPVVVDIRPGASGVIGGDHVARSAPDGYTLLMITNLHSATASLMDKLPYDAQKDFEPVILVGATPMILEAHPSVPANTLAELVDLARSEPRRVTFGSAGHGSPSQLGGELLSAMSRTDMMHVPYKGAGQATSDLLGNHVTFVFSNPMSTLNLVQSGQLKALAVSSPERMAVLPEVPTVAESGYPGFDVSTWWGVLAPAGTPAPVLERLNEAFNEIIRLPEIRERFDGMGMNAKGGSREDLAEQIRQEIAIWKQLAAERGLSAQ